MFKLIFFLLLLSTVNGRPSKKDTKCGYASCHPIKDGFINVHLVPHTHDDVGWLKTVDQYYYGSKSDIQLAGVQYILDSVIDALKKNNDRRFIYVETAFFWKWWMQQHDFIKHQVKNFVKNGQLEFIGGGWSMNDEAATNYQSIIDQFTWGLRKLNETFGECGRPKIGWQIDPFGHSREQASIFAQLGFDGLLLGRIDYQEKLYRFSTKTPELIWKSSNNLDNSDIFTGILYNTYAPPKGFCFDILCKDTPIIDDKHSPDYNVDQKVDDLFDYLHNMTDVYITNNLILTMGEDFHYQDANIWYKNLEKLIFYANKRQETGSKYNLIYSTPSCYVKAVSDESKNRTWSVKNDDFFPYASDPHSFWTGYFTSRPTIKRFERQGNNFLQVCKQLYALTDLGPEDWVDLNSLREAMGVMQHHDAITGTEKEHVAHDYARILQNGIDECKIITSTALKKLITTSNNFTHCLLTNISSCPYTENHKNFITTIYNPLSRSISKYIRIPVTGKAYSVKCPEGKEHTVQLLPISQAVLNTPGRISNATVELIFFAGNIPPLGFKSFYIEQIEGNTITKRENIKNHNYKDTSFTIDSNTGLLSQITMNNITLKISQEFLYYKGFVGDNSKASNRSSGAYIFRPENQAEKITDKAEITVYRGELIAEVHQIFNEWISQIIRIYNHENLIEFDWIVGPIPDQAENGKEIISRFQTNLQTNQTFYTDSNGRELLKRVRNYRPTWNLELEEEIAGNYYPITSKIVLVDESESIEMAVLTDRSQGGTSLRDGQIELMVHRNCLHDDAFGVGEALVEKAFNQGLVARGSHYLIIGSRKDAFDGKTTAAQERDLAQKKLLDTWTFLSDTEGLSFDAYKSKYTMKYSGLKRALPDNVQILTFEPWEGFSFLLRLEHVFELNEDPILSKPVEIDLKNLFTGFEIKSIKETTLGANQWLEDNDRLPFNSGENIVNFLHEDENFQKSTNYLKYKLNSELYNNNIEENILNKRAIIINASKNIDDLVINLNPMQIRTFVIEIIKN